MRLRSWISSFGRSSVDICRVLETADRQRTVLVSGVARFVCMDFAKGISVPFPEAAKRHLLPASPPPAVRCFPNVEVPESAPVGSFLSTIKVRYDDMDINWHSRHYVYTALALECAAEAAAAGYYSRIHDDIAFYRPRSTTCIHLSESFAGDELKFNTWQDSGNAMLLHFLVESPQQKTCYINVEFDVNAVHSKL